MLVLCMYFCSFLTKYNVTIFCFSFAQDSSTYGKNVTCFYLFFCFIFLTLNLLAQSAEEI